MRNKLFGYILGLATAVGITAYAAKNTDLIHIFGTTGSDTELRVSGGDGVIKYDNTANKLQFSNNSGSDFKDLGTGGGGQGGTNTLADDNADFESGSPPSSWTASGGTFTGESGSPLFGAQSGEWDSNASSQTLTSAAKNMSSFIGLQGGRCVGLIKYAYPSGAGGDYTLEVYDGSNVISDPLDLPLTTIASQEAFVVFTCPTSGTIALRLQSQVADADVITIDDAFLGSDIKGIEVAGGEFVGEMHYPVTTNCIPSVTNTSLTPFPTDSDCPAPTIDYQLLGEWDASDNDKLDLNINALPPGTYKVTVNTPVRPTAAAAAALRITDGTTDGNNAAVVGDGSSHYPLTISAWFTYTTSGDRSFELEASSASGAVETNISTNNRELTWSVIRYPLASEKAINFDKADWFVRASIQSSVSNLSLGVTAHSPFEVDGNANLTLTAASESDTVYIACQGSETPAGTTCSSDSEQAAISFFPPDVGRYKVCADFTLQQDVGSGENVTEQLKLAVTSNTASAEGDITIDGTNANSQRVLSGGSGDDVRTRTIVRLCDEFNLHSTGMTTVRMFGRTQVTGTPNLNEIILLDSSTEAVVYSVERMSANRGGITFNGLASFPGETTAMKIYAVDLSSGKTINREYGNWIDSVDDDGAGRPTLNLTAGAFTEDPVCTCITETGNQNRICQVFGSATTAEVPLILENSTSGADADAGAHVICVGK